MQDEAKFVGYATRIFKQMRGELSQRALSKRLGYKGNPVAAWEAGRRHPSASAVFTAMAYLGIDLDHAFSTFDATHQPADYRTQAVADWLDHLRGERKISELAEQLDVSRFTLGRWLSGQTEIRFFELLAFVDLVNDRLPVLVSQWVTIEAVPELNNQLSRIEAAKRIARDHPWSEIILRLVEVAAAQGKTSTSRELRKATSLPPKELAQIISELRAAGLVAQSKGGFTIGETLTVGTEGDAELVKRLKAHWLRAGLARLESGLGEQDLSSYNVMSVSHRDHARIRRKLIETYREIWSIVAESQPEECAAVLNIQLIRYPP